MNDDAARKPPPLGSREWLDEIRRRYPRAYACWSQAEELRLIDAFEAGQTVEELAAVHGRKPSGITDRLVLVGLLDASCVRGLADLIGASFAVRSESTAARDVAPCVLCDGCRVGLADHEVFTFPADATGECNDWLELCADCHDAARRRLA